MQHIDITKLSETELKALGFDIQNELAQMQNNLKMLAEELDKRVRERQQKAQEDAARAVLPPSPTPEEAAESDIINTP